jgi:RNA polymerase sigma factor (sigma-70 family)
MRSQSIGDVSLERYSVTKPHRQALKRRSTVHRAGEEMSDVSLALQSHIALPLESASAEEDEMVERARKGDVQAFDMIMQHYEGRLLRFLTGMVSDVEVARELCQDTFLAAYQALPKTRDGLRLSAWLYTIALNRARSHHRRRRLRYFLPFEEDHHAPSVEDSQEQVATHDLVQKVLQRMPAKNAEVLLLQTSGGMSCREIAGVLGCSEGAVKLRLLRARESFRKYYQLEVGPA